MTLNLLLTCTMKGSLRTLISSKHWCELLFDVAERVNDKFNQFSRRDVTIHPMCFFSDFIKFTLPTINAFFLVIVSYSRELLVDYKRSESMSARVESDGATPRPSRAYTFITRDTNSPSRSYISESDTDSNTDTETRYIKEREQRHTSVPESETKEKADEDMEMGQGHEELIIEEEAGDVQEEDEEEEVYSDESGKNYGVFSLNIETRFDRKNIIKKKKKIRDGNVFF